MSAADPLRPSAPAHAANDCDSHRSGSFPCLGHDPCEGVLSRADPAVVPWRPSKELQRKGLWHPLSPESPQRSPFTFEPSRALHGQPTETRANSTSSSSFELQTERSPASCGCTHRNMPRQFPHMDGQEAAAQACLSTQSRSGKLMQSAIQEPRIGVCSCCSTPKGK